MKIIQENHFNKVTQQIEVEIYIELENGKKEYWGRVNNEEKEKVFEMIGAARLWIEENRKELKQNENL